MDLYEKLDGIIERGDTKELLQFEKEMAFKNRCLNFVLATVSVVLGMVLYYFINMLNVNIGIDIILWNVIAIIVIMVIASYYTLSRAKTRAKDKKEDFTKDLVGQAWLTFIMSGGMVIGCFIAARFFY